MDKPAPAYAEEDALHALGLPPEQDEARPERDELEVSVSVRAVAVLSVSERLAPVSGLVILAPALESGGLVQKVPDHEPRLAPGHDHELSLY